jgi:hypothetical protein
MTNAVFVHEMSAISITQKRGKIKKNKSDNFNGTSARPFSPVQNHI